MTGLVAGQSFGEELFSAVCRTCEQSSATPEDLHLIQGWSSGLNCFREQFKCVKTQTCLKEDLCFESRWTRGKLEQLLTNSASLAVAESSECFCPQGVLGLC